MESLLSSQVESSLMKLSNYPLIKINQVSAYLKLLFSLQKCTSVKWLRQLHVRKSYEDDVIVLLIKLRL